MIGSWKIRGLNDPNKQSEVKSLIAKYHLVVVGLIEIGVKWERS